MTLPTLTQPQRRTTFQNSTRDFGVPLRTHRVEPNTAEHAAFWDDPCWTQKAQRRSVEAPVAAESVQPACPTCSRAPCICNCLKRGCAGCGYVEMCPCGLTAETHCRCTIRRGLALARVEGLLA